MVSLRTTIAPLLLALLLVTSGCLGLLTGDERLEYEASPVSVTDSVVADAGYELQSKDELPIDETVEFQGQTRDIYIVNHVAMYSTTQSADDEVPRVGMFAVLSTPQAKVFGQALNPIGRVPYEQLLSRVLERTDGIKDVSRTGTRSATVLGQDTEVVQFTGTVDMEGETVDVYLDVTRVKHGDDFVIAVAVYPTVTPDEADNVDTLLAGIEH